jgi:hypothetical protein
VKLHANHVSVGESGGEYFQVSFDSEAPSDDDDFDVSAPAHPYLFIQRQFEDDDEDVCYIETHDHDTYTGHFRLRLIEFTPTHLAFEMARRDHKHVEVDGDLRQHCRSQAAGKRPRQPADSYDMSPVLFGTGKSARTSWFYFTEDELSPGAARVGNYKAVFNLRGDNGASTGGLAVDSNQGWKGPNKYVATVPQVFDLWQDPQERYDIFMNNYTERTWTLVTINAAIGDLMKTYVKYPPRKLQGEAYTGPITISECEKFQHIRNLLAKEGVRIPIPTGN